MSKSNEPKSNGSATSDAGGELQSETGAKGPTTTATALIADLLHATIAT